MAAGEREDVGADDLAVRKLNADQQHFITLTIWRLKSARKFE
jgi:hypothetical protein